MVSRRSFCRCAVVLLASLVFSVVLATAPDCLAQGADNGAQGLARALEAQQQHTNTLLAKPGVVGTAVGEDGRGRSVVKVYVAAAEDGVDIARQLNGVPVDVQVTGHIVALKRPPKGDPVDPTARFERPVPIGVSTGHPAMTAGTIGCRVVDGSGVVYALSNNHVYANEDRAELGDRLIQPGTFDGGVLPDDDIATLVYSEPLDFGGGDNVIDAAIGVTTVSLLGVSTPSDGYGTPQSTPVQAAVGMQVTKYGRTTSLTEGRIDGINATINVGYDTGVARFVNQIVITPAGFSSGGDSGSLIVVKDKRGKKEGANHLKPVGLLFAGSSLATIANPIQPVLARFGVSVDDGQ